MRRLSHMNRSSGGVGPWLSCSPAGRTTTSAGTVRDLDAAAGFYETVANLAEVGVTIVQEPFEGPFGTTFAFIDPEGYAITVHDRTQWAASVGVMSDPAAEPAEPAPVPADAAAHPLRLALLLIAAFGTGVLVALQSRINGELGQRLGDGFLAALISFGSGLVILSIASLFWRPGRVGIVRVASAVRTRRIPWWYVVGGSAGALFVLGQSLVVGLVGVALFTVGVVAGQTVSSLLIDRRGLGSMAAKPVTPRRLVGAALALVAVVLAASSELRPGIPLWVLIVPFAAGLAVGWQQAVNGQVKAIAGSAFTATFGNFAVGAGVLVVAAVIHTLIVGWPAHFPATPWLYLGGSVGTIFIAGQAAIVRSTGVLLMGLAVLSGQLLTAVVFDLVAPVQSHAIAPLTIFGAALTLVAVAIASVPRGRSGSPSR